MRLSKKIALSFILALYANTVLAANYVVAVLPFTASDDSLKNYAETIPQLLSANLSGSADVVVVERTELDKVLSEHEFNLTGIVNPQTAAKLGFLTGANIIISGRIFSINNEMVVISKLIGVETSRVYGATSSLPLSGSIVAPITELSEKLLDTIKEKGQTLLVRDKDNADVLQKLKILVKGKSLPSVTVSVRERSLNDFSLDPAVTTEISKILIALGFSVYDRDTMKVLPDVEISGEAFSESGIKNGQLVSSKGRIELKALDRKTGKVIFADRIQSVAVDLSPEIAGKTALSKGAAELTERLVRALVME